MKNTEMPKCQIKYVWSPHDVILELLVTKLNLNKMHTELRELPLSRWTCLDTNSFGVLGKHYHFTNTLVLRS